MSSTSVAMSDRQQLPAQLVDPKGRVWQERTVVVKQDPEGYGFNLSKEMPVFVDRVIQGSSAERAGITAGDRIIKVNGLDVLNYKHTEVVEMIRDSSHVTLTLVGKLAQNGTRAKDHVEISPPKQMQELTLQTMKMMLQKQRKTYETMAVNYSKSPSEKLEKDLRDCESIIKILEFEIASKSPPIDAHIHTTAASINALTGRSPSSHQLPRKLHGDDMDIPSRKHLPSSVSPTKGLHNSVKSGSAKYPFRAATFNNGSISPTKRRHHIVAGGTQPGDNSDLSDDDLSDEVDGAAEAGPFSSLQELRNNPAHMAVFIHYLNTNKFPNTMLFYLIALSYQNHCKAADLKQRGMDIFWTFFLEQSPLPLELDDGIKTRALNTLETEENENHLRSAFVEARETLSENIIVDLANYRHKRVMGLAGMFGDHMLTSNMTITRQVEVVNSILLPDIKERCDEKGCSGVEAASRNNAIAACLATFVLDSCGKSGIAKATSTPPLDKIQTFTRVDVLLKKGRGGKKKHSITKHGHTLHPETYSKPTMCDLCGKLLWGIIYHGYHCSECKMNIHRYFCIAQLEQPCLGKNPGFMSSKRRRASQPIRKISLPALLTNSTTEEQDQPAMETPGKPDEEADRVSPLLEPITSEVGEGEAATAPEDTPRHTKLRSLSDPKHMLLIQSLSMTGEQMEPKRDSMRVIRTQSAKYETRPDHMDMKNSSEGGHPHLTMSSSDDSLIGAPKLDIIAEGGPASRSLLHVDEEIRELMENDIEEELLPWALTVKREVKNSLKPYEVQRQEYIKELVYTEKTHLHKLKTMRYLYKIPLTKQGVLTPEQVEQLFPSLEELILFHSGLCSDLKERVAMATSGVVKNIADVLLQRFDGAAGERLCHACSVFASNQVNADQLFTDWRRRNERFRTFIREAESHPVCRRHRLTLKELMPIAWQRLTKYKLLLDNILASYKKHWDELDASDKEEAQKVETSLTCVKGILQYVNKQVRLAQNRQKLMDYQGKLDTSALERTSHPIAQQFKNLDLCTGNRKLLHEGPLTWKIQHRKVIELHALLLTDVLVFMERHEDRDKYYLRCHSVESIGGTKEELSPIIRLKDCLLRHAAADRGGRTFLIVNNSSLMKLAQMYEFISEGPQEKRQWEDAIKRAMMGTQDIMSPEPPTSPSNSEFNPARLPLSMYGSQLDPREQLNKIDEDIKKLLNDKLTILRAMQGGVGEKVTAAGKGRGGEGEAAQGSEEPMDLVAVAIEQAGEMASTLSHVMVPNPTKNIVAETQSRLSDVIAEMQRNLSKLMIALGGKETQNEGDTSKTEGTEEGVCREEGEQDDVRFSITSNSDVCKLPPPADAATLGSQEGEEEEEEEEEDLSKIIAPPDTFSGDDSATPTPQLEIESVGPGSGTTTPRTSPCDTGPLSPLSPRQQEVKIVKPAKEEEEGERLKSPGEQQATAKETRDVTSDPEGGLIQERLLRVSGSPQPRTMRIIASSNQLQAEKTEEGGEAKEKHFSLKQCQQESSDSSTTEEPDRGGVGRGGKGGGGEGGGRKGGEGEEKEINRLQSHEGTDL